MFSKMALSCSACAHLKLKFRSAKSSGSTSTVWELRSDRKASGTAAIVQSS